MHRRPPAWYLLVAAAVGSARLGELLISRRNLRLRGAELIPDDGFRAIVALHLALGGLPVAENAVRGWRRSRWVPVWAGLLTLATGLRWWSIASLGRSWSARVARVDNVSTRGPYRWIRHPNYLALIVEFFAGPALAGAWLSAVLLSALHGAVIWRRIRLEEATLAEVPDYRDRFGARARFIPGFF